MARGEHKGMIRHSNYAVKENVMKSEIKDMWFKYETMRRIAEALKISVSDVRDAIWGIHWRTVEDIGVALIPDSKARGAL